MPPHIRGYEFLKTAIRYLRTNPEAIYKITTDLYGEIARVHGSTETKVERGIRYAIKSIKGEDADLYKVLGRTGHFSNGEFIATLNESIMVRMALEAEA